jgi:hypothetical protein
MYLFDFTFSQNSYIINTYFNQKSGLLLLLVGDLN